MANNLYLTRHCEEGDNLTRQSPSLPWRLLRQAELRSAARNDVQSNKENAHD
ncbi:MAG: hypothetical protein ISR59_05150 [Anaerolineales bacterium]|uniref:Uncharacterized protein n=1 Tax=Candidatus Desulfolinea nitratireducens TaxID=2841698 RepID=A0A8J6NLQ6_9CHLR|nr:hypothetical protein [Candidatus Desulfolinea nitratireducens]MBL6960476.1 hypothetical protein [Anaerolineales bacterium]